MTDRPEIGTGGRPWGSAYFDADHAETAKKIYELEPDLVTWIREPHPEDELDMPIDLRDRYWARVKSFLPNATLVDQGKILLKVKLMVYPLTPQEIEFLAKLDENNRVAIERHERKIQASKKSKDESLK